MLACGLGCLRGSQVSSPSKPAPKVITSQEVVEARAQLERAVPPGAALADAQTLLESEGFRPLRVESCKQGGGDHPSGCRVHVYGYHDDVAWHTTLHWTAYLHEHDARTCDSVELGGGTYSL